jgi:hypothetical protein
MSRRTRSRAARLALDRKSCRRLRSKTRNSRRPWSVHLSTIHGPPLTAFTPQMDAGPRAPAGVHFPDDFATLRSRLRVRVDRDAERELARTRSSSGAATPSVLRSPGPDTGADGAGVLMPEVRLASGSHHQAAEAGMQSDGGARTPAGVRFEDDGVDLAARLRTRLARDMRGRSASASQLNSGVATPVRAGSAERRVDGAATPASARSASAERGPGAE